MKLFTSILILAGFMAGVDSTYAQQVNYNLVCVDSVWYEPGNPLFINVRIYNGDTVSMNYPSVQIVSPANDTISNPSNFVNYFAQGGNILQTYTDTITQTGITDFSNYTFLMSEGFGDTTVVIHLCALLSVEELQANNLNIFPNPANDKLYIISDAKTGVLKIYDTLGNNILNRSVPADSLAIDVSRFASGIYLLVITDNKKIYSSKFLKP
jgi:hypothetical protein